MRNARNPQLPFPHNKGTPRKCLAGVDRSGRGCNPRPAQGRRGAAVGGIPDIFIPLAMVDNAGGRRGGMKIPE